MNETTITTPENMKKAEYLNMKEAPEQIGDWKSFKLDWLTLQESAELINRSDRYVRQIIEAEKIESRTFVGGEFGKRATRCVNKAQFLAWFQANMNTKPEQVNIQAQTPEFTQNQALANLVSFRDTVQGVSGNLIELNSNLKGISSQMTNIFEKIVNESIDLKNKWIEDKDKRSDQERADKERRAEIDMRQIALQEQQLKAQQDLLAKVMTPAPKAQSNATAIISIASVVLVAVMGYFGYQYLNTQSRTFLNQITEKDKALTETLTTFQSSLKERDAEISQLKQKLQDIEKAKATETKAQ